MILLCSPWCPEPFPCLPVAIILTWPDKSEKDRHRTLEFIDTFRERDVRDESGIGVVRDAFSDLMFAGTSTVQTRATYFLLAPWCCPKAQGVRPAHLGRPRIRPLEAGGDVTALLGRHAKKGLKQVRGAIYRQGLGTRGIRRFAGSRA